MNLVEEARRHADQAYREAWRRLNAAARLLGDGRGLTPAVRFMLAVCEDNGFIRDDLGASVRYVLESPENPGRTFRAQYNARRGERHAGAGRRRPPAGRASTNGACFLCVENLYWMHGGLELGIDFEARGVPMVVLPQPYPFASRHVVIATRKHVPQSHPDIREVVRLVLELAALLPSFVVAYNGAGAGASIPRHFHAHAFRPGSGSAYALELAATRSSKSTDELFFVDRYPIDVLAVNGGRDSEAVEAAGTIAEAWRLRHGPDASFNVIAVGRERLYIAARDRKRERVPELSGAIAALEVAGEVVLSTTDEVRRVERGDIDYGLIWRSLATVSVPGFREVGERMIEERA